MNPSSLSGPWYIESWILFRMTPMTSKSWPAMLTDVPDRGRALKIFLGRAIAENDDTTAIDKVAFIEVAAIVDVELAHLPVRKFDTAR